MRGRKNTWSGGLSDSVQATVLKRKGQVVTSILETKAVIEDCRSNAGFDIWELAILPFLLNNSDTWVEISICPALGEWGYY